MGIVRRGGVKACHGSEHFFSKFARGWKGLLGWFGALSIFARLGRSDWIFPFWFACVRAAASNTGQTGYMRLVVVWLVQKLGFAAHTIWSLLVFVLFTEETLFYLSVTFKHFCAQTWLSAVLISILSSFSFLFWSLDKSTLLTRPSQVPVDKLTRLTRGVRRGSTVCTRQSVRHSRVHHHYNHNLARWDVQEGNFWVQNTGEGQLQVERGAGRTEKPGL